LLFVYPSVEVLRTVHIHAQKHLRVLRPAVLRALPEKYTRIMGIELEGVFGDGRATSRLDDSGSSLSFPQAGESKNYGQCLRKAALEMLASDGRGRLGEHGVRSL
jgi:hypothetical protein